MKRLKRFNELFDTEDLKMQNEIDYLTGAIDKKELSRNIMSDKSAQSIYNLLEYKFPFFKECTNDNNPYTGLMADEKQSYYVFYFKNETWFIGLAVKPTGNHLYDINLIRKGVNLTITPGNSFHFYTPIVDYDPNKTVAIVFENLTIEQIYEHVEKHFIPMMKKTGFKYLLNVGGPDMHSLRRN